jgi:hypothetical protein
MNWGLELLIWNLETRIPLFGWPWNSSVETGRKFRAKSIMCYFGLAYFRAAPLRIGWNCENLKNIKYSKTLKKLIKKKI